MSSLYFRSLRIYPIWLGFIKNGRRGTWEDYGACSGSAPPGSGPWRAFPSEISLWGGTLVLAAAAESCADARGEIVWGRQQEVDKQVLPSLHFNKAMAELTFQRISLETRQLIYIEFCVPGWVPRALKSCNSVKSVSLFSFYR